MRFISWCHSSRQRISCVASVAKGLEWTNDNYAGASVRNCKCTGFHSSSVPLKVHLAPRLHFSTTIQPGISWEINNCAILLSKLEIALKDESIHEAWEAFGNFKRLHGFPEQSLVSRMIVLLSYSSNSQCLHKAYDLVLAVLKEKPVVLHHDSLSRLALTLARNQMPVPASTILRIMLERGKLPPTGIWSTLFSYLAKTRTGSYLACEILIEICEFFVGHNSSAKSRKQIKSTKPDTTIFNLVLGSCIRFGSILKAKEIVELMARVGAVADANSIILIARIFEMTGQRDELKKLKAYIDGVSSVLLNRHYRQFYDSLLSLHFKYSDIEAAAELVLNLYQRPESCHSNSNGFLKQCVLHIGSSNLRMGNKLIIEPEHLQNDFVVDAQSSSRFVHFTEGRLVPSNVTIAKLINAYVQERKLAKLSNLLINIHKIGSKEAGLSLDVIDACVQLGWLETAHDILDDLEAAAIPIGANAYASLLRAYRDENKLEESQVLVKQMRNMGLFVNISDEKASAERSCLVVLLEREIGKEDSPSRLLYEFNSSILFFCKAKMIEDALRTFKRMKQMKVQPTTQTFSHLVNCYSSMKLYREITILWGELRRRLEDGVLAADRDLFECLLWNFIRGGYFERVTEVISYMIKHNMYTDNWKYRREFLKFHKDLYRNLKATDAKTDAQSKRLEHVRAFRKWVGIDQKLKKESLLLTSLPPLGH